MSCCVLWTWWDARQRLINYFGWALLGYTRTMRYIVIGMLVLIIGSLGSALFYMMKDHGKSDRTVRALTWRVALSMSLFLLLMAGYYFGLLPDRL